MVKHNHIRNLIQTHSLAKSQSGIWIFCVATLQTTESIVLLSGTVEPSDRDLSAFLTGKAFTTWILNILVYSNKYICTDWTVNKTDQRGKFYANLKPSLAASITSNLETLRQKYKLQLWSLVPEGLKELGILAIVVATLQTLSLMREATVFFLCIVLRQQSTTTDRISMQPWTCWMTGQINVALSARWNWELAQV